MDRRWIVLAAAIAIVVTGALVALAMPELSCHEPPRIPGGGYQRLTDDCTSNAPLRIAVAGGSVVLALLVGATGTPLRSRTPGAAPTG